MRHPEQGISIPKTNRFEESIGGRLRMVVPHDPEDPILEQAFEKFLKGTPTIEFPRLFDLQLAADPSRTHNKGVAILTDESALHAYLAWQVHYPGVASVQLTHGSVNEGVTDETFVSFLHALLNRMRDGRLAGRPMANAYTYVTDGLDDTGPMLARLSRAGFYYDGTDFSTEIYGVQEPIYNRALTYLSHREELSRQLFYHDNKHVILPAHRLSLPLIDAPRPVLDPSLVNQYVNGALAKYPGEPHTGNYTLVHVADPDHPYIEDAFTTLTHPGTSAYHARSFERPYDLRCAVALPTDAGQQQGLFALLDDRGNPAGYVLSKAHKPGVSAVQLVQAGVKPDHRARTPRNEGEPMGAGTTLIYEAIRALKRVDMPNGRRPATAYGHVTEGYPQWENTVRMVQTAGLAHVGGDWSTEVSRYNGKGKENPFFDIATTWIRDRYGEHVLQSQRELLGNDVIVLPAYRFAANLMGCQPINLHEKQAS